MAIGDNFLNHLILEKIYSATGPSLESMEIRLHQSM